MLDLKQMYNHHRMYTDERNERDEWDERGGGVSGVSGMSGERSVRNQRALLISQFSPPNTFGKTFWRLLCTENRSRRIIFFER